jgi:hypothetical protein
MVLLQKDNSLNTIKRDIRIRDHLMSKKKNIQFYRFSFILGIISCIISFVWAYNIVPSNNSSLSHITQKTKKQNSYQKNNDVTHTHLATPSKSLVYDEFTALINKINAQGSFEIYNIDTNTSNILNINSHTKILDRNKFKIKKEQLKAGDIVQVTAISGEAKSISLNTDVCSYTHINNIKVNTDLRTLSFDDHDYHVAENAIIEFKYDNNRYSLKDINAMSVVNLKCLNNYIWFIEIIKATGNLLLHDNDKLSKKIISASVKIDSRIVRSIDSANGYVLSEGPHTISITGDNIQTYSKDIFVNPFKNVDVNLSEIQFKYGILKLNLKQSDCCIYIDDVKTSINEPILLSYGEHNIKITKDNFLDYKQVIKIDNDVCELNINMIQTKKICNITIDSDPENAEISIDNIYIGIAPINIPVEYGKHIISAKIDGYSNTNIPIIASSDTFNYTIVLRK